MWPKGALGSRRLVTTPNQLLDQRRPHFHTTALQLAVSRGHLYPNNQVSPGYVAVIFI